MLQFLRKYQKFFFGVIAVVIIASFCFFGTQGAMQGPVEIPDRRIGTLIDQSPLMQKEVDLLAHFLSSSPDDRQLLERGQMPNIFNDGVIQREFLETGLLPLIAKSYFSEISSEIQERIDKVRAYRHYVHPQAPFLSAESVWNRFFPSMKQKIELLGRTQAGEESLRLLGELYLEQKQLPSDVLRRILMFQQQQYEWVAHDPRLDQMDLSLFGFQNLEDWLGPKLMRVLAQVILNGAAEAHKQGYRVSEDEARRSLQANFFAGLKMSVSEHELTQQELQNLYQHQIHLLHREERPLVLLWQKVLEFRRMVDDVGSAVVLDAAAYRQFSDFAATKLNVNSYELPESLRLKNFRDLLKLQTYLEGIAISPSKKPSASLNLPHLFASPAEVLNRTPELVEYRFNAEIAEVTFDTLASRVSLRQVYDWEMEKAHWDLLQKEFPALGQVSASTIEERYAVLESIEPEMRQRIDKSAREAIVLERPEWVEAAFAQAERKTVSFGFRQKGGQLPFIGVTDRNALYNALKRAPLKSENEVAQLVPFRLDTDEYHHYEIVLTQPPSELTLLSFTEASSDGTIDALLNRKLEEIYPEIRKKNTAFFQISNGVWKPLSEVKDFVGAYHYADLLKSIEYAAKEDGVDWPKQEGDTRFPQPLDFYAEYRLRPYLQEALLALRQGESEEAWVRQKDNRLSEQWRLIKQGKELTRAQMQALHLDHVFEQPVPAWSEVIAMQPAQWGFIQALGKKQDEKFNIDGMVKAGQERLANETKHAILEALLQDINAKKAIVISTTEHKEGSVL